MPILPRAAWTAQEVTSRSQTNKKCVSHVERDQFQKWTALNFVPSVKLVTLLLLLLSTSAKNVRVDSTHHFLAHSYARLALLVSAPAQEHRLNVETVQQVKAHRQPWRRLVTNVRVGGMRRKSQCLNVWLVPVDGHLPTRKVCSVTAVSLVRLAQQQVDFLSIVQQDGFLLKTDQLPASLVPQEKQLMVTIT